MLLNSKMETFLLKDNFNSSDSLSPPLLHGPIVTGLLALEYHESLHSLTFGVLSILPWGIMSRIMNSRAGLLYSFCLTVISDKLDNALMFLPSL